MTITEREAHEEEELYIISEEIKEGYRSGITASGTTWTLDAVFYDEDTDEEY